MHMAHRAEVGKLGMKIAMYADLLEKHGIDLPDPTDGELLALWRDSAAVIDAASAFVATLGTSKELIGDDIADAIQAKRGLRVVT